MHEHLTEDAPTTSGQKAPLVVVVSPIALFPVTGGGAARVLSYVRHLRSQGFRIGLVTVHHPARDLATLKAEVDALWIATPAKAADKIAFRHRIREYGRRLPTPIQFLLRRGLRAFRQRWFRDQTGTSTPSALSRARNPVLDSVARTVIAAEKPCAVIATFAWTARCFENAPPGVCKIIDAIDIQHLRSRQALEAGYSLPDAVCSPDEEAAELRRSDVVLAIQAAEYEALQRFIPDRRIILCEHAYPIATEQYSPPPEAKGILFVGNFYQPNNDGIRRFLEHAWPSIRAVRPDATLHICGQVCAAIHRAPEGVALHGVVPTLAPFYRDAALVINPVPYGTGLKIKTVEALCAGKALVTTPAGIAGLPHEGELPYTIAAIEDMAAPITDWLDNPDDRKAMESRALAFARQRFAAQVAYKGLENLLWEAAGKGEATKRQLTVQEGNNL